MPAYHHSVHFHHHHCRKTLCRIRQGWKYSLGNLPLRSDKVSHLFLLSTSQMKFVEAILSNNTTDDHCREFITQKGLEPLMRILGLSNLPIEFPTSPSCQAVSSVCKSVLVSSMYPWQRIFQGCVPYFRSERMFPNYLPFYRPGAVLMKGLSQGLGLNILLFYGQ